MENNKIKKVHIKNGTSYYFDEVITFRDFDFDNILIDEKSHENILIYDISYETLIGAKLLRIRFNKIDGFVRVYDGTRYFTLFGSEKYDTIYNRIRYLIEVKSDIIYVFFFFFTIMQKSKLVLMILYL